MQASRDLSHMHLVVGLLLLILWLESLVHGAPIGIPDLRRCRDVSNVTQCCMLVPTRRPIRFSFGLYPPVQRLRTPAHLVNEEYLEKYNRAYEIIRSLPPNDPRSLAHQTNAHCAMCLGAYLQPGTNAILHVHYSWLFLPWHRWFIYFHERILAWALNDPTFSLPFWNWDNQIDGNSMPVYFDDENSALYDPNRDASHSPPALIELNEDTSTTNRSVIIEDNLQEMYEDVVIPTTADTFMGGAFRLGDRYPSINAQRDLIGGVFDNEVHSNVHVWVGDPLQPLLIDMGSFDAAARDPIFYAHHANVDRLWEVWRTSLPGGPRQVFTDPDFLNTRFLFYDENACPIEVTIRDCLDNEKLGIRYTNVDASDRLWIDYTPS